MKGNTVLKASILIFVAIFVIHQLYSSFYKPITTESAEYYNAIDGLDISGTIIRRESIVKSNVTGSLHFVAENGCRVAKGGVIALIYDDAGVSTTIERINNLTEQITDITEMQNYNDLQAADIDLAGEKVDDKLNQLIISCRGGNYSESGECINELLSAINRRQMITGEQTDFSAKLGELNSELSSLKASLPAAKGSITASQSGYFVSGQDGYENVLKCDNLTEITDKFLDSAKPQKIEENAIGKIVSDYEWYIAAKVSLNDSLRYKEGDSLTINTNIKSNPQLPVKVKQINISDTGNDAVIIFSCQQMNNDLASIRTGSMKIINKTYEGLKIPKKSLRVVDGKTGVYVVSGITLKFVPVTVLYNYKTDDYIICKQEKSTNTVLRLYDEVVVKGKKLYDGKIIS